MGEYPYKAAERVRALIGTLRTIVDRDPEQEVQGIAVQVLDAALTAIKADLGDDPVVRATVDVISPETIAAGEPVRAIDALLVAEQLDAAIGEPPRRRPATA